MAGQIIGFVFAVLLLILVTGFTFLYHSVS
jgi:tetrahydromethanopterin S-methyltransferase subunit F